MADNTETFLAEAERKFNNLREKAERDFLFEHIRGLQGAVLPVSASAPGTAAQCQPQSDPCRSLS